MDSINKHCWSILANWNCLFSSSGRIIGNLSFSGEKEVDLAVKSAHAAFKIWSQKSGMERSSILLEAARIIRVCDIKAYCKVLLASLLVLGVHRLLWNLARIRWIEYTLIPRNQDDSGYDCCVVTFDKEEKYVSLRLCTDHKLIWSDLKKQVRSYLHINIIC